MNRSQLLASAWFPSIETVAGLDFHPLSPLRFCVLQEVGHPIFDDTASRDLRAFDLLVFTWVMTVPEGELLYLYTRADIADVPAYVKDKAARLNFPPERLEEISTFLEGRLAGVLAAAVESVKKQTGQQLPSEPLPPAPTSSPALSTEPEPLASPSASASCSAALPSPSGSNSSTPATAPATTSHGSMDPAPLQPPPPPLSPAPAPPPTSPPASASTTPYDARHVHTKETRCNLSGIRYVLTVACYDPDRKPAQATPKQVWDAVFNAVA
jgi:hypothetical protein